MGATGVRVLVSPGTRQGIHIRHTYKAYHIRRIICMLVSPGTRRGFMRHTYKAYI